ncbi:uncharacterized protein LOC124916711 [Impatiens glandulifera]|uniref:uncharacterized protein LOC124916711 n=1 Tax=Impatiens glandulifera TaxID=253017 RepID=UPI001FB0942A|nr:uncharacterized protein LOC124916711 [Impatiens glandulifera]
MGGHNPIEVAKTVMEVADVAWMAVERCQHHHLHHNQPEDCGDRNHVSSEEGEQAELESMRSENRRLRNLLKQNLKLLQNLSEAQFLQDCPPDLHARLPATVNSDKFTTQLKSQKRELIDGTGAMFPFKEASGSDIESAEVLIKIDLDEPSWWVWVTDEMVPSNVEELSGIDDENYVVVTQEHVVDGVANFMARCILSNPKTQKMSPEELQKSLNHALGGMNKVETMLHIWHAGKTFYALSSWGLTLFGLYKSRSILKLAANGVHTTGKFVLKAL